MNRIKETFKLLAEQDQGALMCYVPTIGIDYRASIELAALFFENGVDMIELSIPCAFPWHDGSSMQKHHLKSIETNADPSTAFLIGKEIRKQFPEKPILPMAPSSAIFEYGITRFAESCNEISADGVLLPEYPVYTQQDPFDLKKLIKKNDIDFISFCDGISLSPPGTRQYDLLKTIIREASGFIFQTAVQGPTGARESIASDYLSKAVLRIRELQEEESNRVPILLGFGLSKPDHVKKAIREIKVDAVVVGSAVSDLIHNNSSHREIAAFIQSLKEATIK